MPEISLEGMTNAEKAKALAEVALNNAAQAAKLMSTVPATIGLDGKLTIGGSPQQQAMAQMQAGAFVGLANFYAGVSNTFARLAELERSDG